MIKYKYPKTPSSLSSYIINEFYEHINEQALNTWYYRDHQIKTTKIQLFAPNVYHITIRKLIMEESMKVSNQNLFLLNRLELKLTNT